MFLHLGRPIQDLQFWTSFEVGQLYVPNAFVQISSIMPQKRNPVPIEHLRHLASQTIGARPGHARRHAQHALHRHERQRGRDARRWATRPSPPRHRVLDLLTALIPALSDRSATRVAENIRRSCITVTELADSWCARRACPSARRTRSPPHVARAVVAARGRSRDRRLCAVPGGLRGASRAARPGSTPSSLPRSSRPSISSPCATASAGRRRERSPRRWRAIAASSQRLRAIAEDDAGARGRRSGDELAERIQTH